MSESPPLEPPATTDDVSVSQYSYGDSAMFQQPRAGRSSSVGRRRQGLCATPRERSRSRSHRLQRQSGNASEGYRPQQLDVVQQQRQQQQFFLQNAGPSSSSQRPSHVGGQTASGHRVSEITMDPALRTHADRHRSAGTARTGTDLQRILNFLEEHPSAAPSQAPVRSSHSLQGSLIAMDDSRGDDSDDDDDIAAAIRASLQLTEQDDRRLSLHDLDRSHTNGHSVTRSNRHSYQKEASRDRSLNQRRSETPSLPGAVHVDGPSRTSKGVPAPPEQEHQQQRYEQKLKADQQEMNRATPQAAAAGAHLVQLGAADLKYFTDGGDDDKNRCSGSNNNNNNNSNKDEILLTVDDDQTANERKSPTQPLKNTTTSQSMRKSPQIEPPRRSFSGVARRRSSGGLKKLRDGVNSYTRTAYQRRSSRGNNTINEDGVGIGFTMTAGGSIYTSPASQQSEQERRFDQKRINDMRDAERSAHEDKKAAAVHAVDVDNPNSPRMEYLQRVRVAERKKLDQNNPTDAQLVSSQPTNSGALQQNMSFEDLIVDECTSEVRADNDIAQQYGAFRVGGSPVDDDSDSDCYNAEDDNHGMSDIEEYPSLHPEGHRADDSTSLADSQMARTQASTYASSTVAADSSDIVLTATLAPEDDTETGMIKNEDRQVIYQQVQHEAKEDARRDLLKDIVNAETTKVDEPEAEALRRSPVILIVVAVTVILAVAVAAIVAKRCDLFDCPSDELGAVVAIDHDTCDDAITLFTNSERGGQQRSFSTAGGSPDSDLLCNISDSIVSGPGVWFKTVGRNLPLHASLQTSIDFNASISVYTGDRCADLTCITSTSKCSDGCSVAWDANNEQRYWILVRGSNEFAFSLSLDELLANAICEGAVLLDPAEATSPSVIAGSSIGGSTASIVDCQAAASSVRPSAGSTVWFRVTGTGLPVRASTCRSSGSGYHLSVFQGYDCRSTACLTGSNYVPCGSNAYATFPTIAGETYFMAVTSTQDDSPGEFVLEVETKQANDICQTASAASLFNNQTSILSSNADASTDLIPNCDDSSSDMTETDGPASWVDIVGTGSLLLLSTCDSDTPEALSLSVFHGSCEALKCASTVSYIPCDAGDRTSVAFPSEQGRPYKILITSDGSGVDMSYRLNVQSVASNALMGNAQEIMASERVRGSTRGSLLPSTANRLSAALGAFSSPGVWYSFMGTGSLVSIDFVHDQDGSALDALDGRFTVFRTSGDSVVCVFPSLPVCPSSTKEQWMAASGTAYYIVVHGAGDSTGNFEFIIRELQDYATDNCDSSIVPVPANSAAVAVSTVNATNDIARACGNLATNSPGVWLKIEGIGQSAIVSTCDGRGNFNTSIGLFSGDSCDALRCLNPRYKTCKYGSGQESAYIEFEARAGTTYYVMVHGRDGRSGYFNFRYMNASTVADEYIGL